MSNVAEESFANIRTVKAFSNEFEEKLKFANSNQVSYLAGVRKSVYTSLYALLTQALLYGAMAGVIYGAVELYKDGDLTIGNLSSFLFYMTMLVWNFSMVSMVLGNVASVVGASDKIVQMMNH